MQRVPLKRSVRAPYTLARLTAKVSGNKRKEGGEDGQLAVDVIREVSDNQPIIVVYELIHGFHTR